MKAKISATKARGSRPVPAPATRSLFATDIHEFHNERAATDHPRWRSAILALRHRDEGREISNHLGWQSSLPLFETPALAGLERFLRRCVHSVAQRDGWDLTRSDLAIEAWANVNPRGALNHFHNHPNALLSGSYYVSMPQNGGNLVFRDPRDVAYVLQPPYAEGTRAPVTAIVPKEGMLLIFPAWLHHAVRANVVDAERISVAFNVNVCAKTRTRSG